MLKYLLFFPSATFSIFKAEIFPYGLIYALTQKVLISKDALLFIFLVCLSCLWGGYNYQDFTFEVFRSVAAYLNVVLLFFVVSNYNKFELTRLVKVNTFVFYLLLVVGILQISGLSIVLGLGALIELVMSRGAEGVIGNGRGISLLSSEPSRASYEFLFIYMLFRTTLGQNYKLIFYDVLVTVFLLFFIKSATGALFLMIFIIINYKKLFFRVFPFFLFFLFFFGMNLNYLNIDFLGFNSRALDLMFQSVDAIKNGKLWDLFISASGFRGISVYASYLSGSTHLFGYGLGMWESSSIAALYASGYQPSDILYFASRGEAFTSIRPTSFIASTMLDMGLLGTCIVLYCIRSFFILYRTPQFNGAFYCFVFYLFCVGSIGNPIPWLIIGIMVANQKHLNRESIK